MKKLIILLAVATASLGSVTTFAQDVAQLKEMSMKACDAQASLKFVNAPLKIPTMNH
jgi:hypothetical protein